MTATKPRTKNSVVPAYVPKAPDAIMAELWAVKRGFPLKAGQHGIATGSGILPVKAKTLLIQ